MYCLHVMSGFHNLWNFAYITDKARDKYQSLNNDDSNHDLAEFFNILPQK